MAGSSSTTAWPGASTLVVEAPGQAVVLDDPANSVSALDVTAASAEIAHTTEGSASEALTLAGLNLDGAGAANRVASLNTAIVLDGTLFVEGDLALEATESVTSTAASDVTVLGLTTIAVIDDEVLPPAFGLIDVSAGSFDPSGGLEVIGGTVSVATVGDLVLDNSLVTGALAVTAGGGAMVSDLRLDGATGSILALGGPLTVERVEAGLGAVPSSLSLGLDGAAGDALAVSDVVAGDLSIAAATGTTLPGDVTVALVSVDALTVSDGVAGTLTLDTVEAASIAVSDPLGPVTLALVEAEAISALGGATAAGAVVTMDQVRADTITVEAAEIALGFVEAGTMTATVAGDIAKLANTALSDGAGTVSEIALPVLTGTAGSLAVPLPEAASIEIAPFDLLVAVSGDLTASGGGDFLLPRGVVAGGDIHNDVGGVLALDGFATVAFEDEGDIFPDVTGAADVALAADADATGAPGAIAGSLDYTGSGTFLATGAVVLDGVFGTGAEVVAPSATLSAIDSGIALLNSRVDSATLTVIEEVGLAAGDGAISVTDTIVTGTLALDGVAGASGPGALARVEAGAVDIAGVDDVTVEDLVAGGFATDSATVAITRAAVEGLDIDGPSGGGAITSVALTDVSVEGALVLEAGSVALTRVATDDAATVTATGSAAVEDLQAAGDVALAGADVALARAATDGALAVDAGMGGVAIEDLQAAGALTAESDADLTLARAVAAAGADLSAAGTLTVGDLQVAGDAALGAGDVAVDSTDVTGTLTVADGTSLALTDVSLGGADLGTQGAVTVARALVMGDLVTAATGDIAIEDLVVEGLTLAVAGGDLVVRDFLIGDYGGGSGGVLDLENGSGGSEVSAGELTADQAALLDAAPDSASARLVNLNFDDLDVTAIGDILATGVGTTGPLTLTSLEGGIALAETAGAPRIVTAPGGLSVAPGSDFFADVTVEQRGAIEGAAGVTGPGAVMPPAGGTVGIEVGTLIGDAPDPDVIQRDLDAGAGEDPGEDVDPADGLAALPDVLVEIEVRDDPFVPVAPNPGEEDLPGGGGTDDNLGEEEATYSAPFFEIDEPVFTLPAVDFGTLFSATGNETLWRRGGAPAGEEEGQ
ncbi:MAG: hypothetical protein AAFV86_02390 [Pseudomonadota bacterium]